MSKANAELSALRAAKLELERRVAVLECGLQASERATAELAEMLNNAPRAITGHDFAAVPIMRRWVLRGRYRYRYRGRNPLGFIDTDPDADVCISIIRIAEPNKIFTTKATKGD